MSDFKSNLRLLLKSKQELSPKEIEDSIAAAAMGKLLPVWKNSQKRDATRKRAYYFSAEFLIGRSVFNNLYNLRFDEKAESVLEIYRKNLNALEALDDPALGNGGLGRLAACFLDSAASLKLPLMGYGIRYKYGLFRQSFEDGFQKENIDDWARFGDPWSIRQEDEKIEVEFSDMKVLAVPYDTPIIGFGGRYITTLRLWQAESPEPFSFELFVNQ